MIRRWWLVALSVTLAGCSLRAPYTAPELAPVVVKNADQALFVTQSYDAKWWRQFEDPVLSQLEEDVLLSNHDVRMAVARVDQARALFRDVELDKFPSGGIGVSVDRRAQVVPGFTEERRQTTTYRGGLDAFWELDLFGGVRASMQSAAATAEGLDASLEDVRVSVSAEVARNYFELRGLQQQLAVAERGLVNQRETLRLTEVRRNAGIGEDRDVASAAARVAGIEASLSPIRLAIARHVHALAVLTGVRPGELRVDLSPRAYPPLAKVLSLGDPSLLLRRRPDVRAAERRLAAATAREGVAAADLLPRVTVSGFLGFIAGRGNLFGKSDSRAWAVTPALSWAALDLGSARARLRGVEAATRESLASYEQTVLRAIEETENALVAYREQQARLIHLGDQARESGRAAAIARIRYREGLSDFLALLDAERTQLQAEDAVAQAEAGLFTSVVAVYKALGGISGEESSSVQVVRSSR
jgi:multidrug efflux system outer membrane protein